MEELLHTREQALVAVESSRLESELELAHLEAPMLQLETPLGTVSLKKTNEILNMFLD